jgi:TolA-binding protein
MNDEIGPHVQKKLLLTAAALGALLVQACAPPLYRTSQTSNSKSTTTAPQSAPLPREEPQTKPLPQEGKISEQDLKKGAPTQPAIKETARSPIPPPTAPPLADDSSLLAKIAPGTPPQRAASLRLTEEGRKLLEAGDYARALNRFEKTIVIDSTNGYGYYYLAKTHYRLGRYNESLNFLDVAESRLSGEPFWLAEVHALRGENFRAQGSLQRAEASYGQALRMNPGNRTAADALSRLQADALPEAR